MPRPRRSDNAKPSQCIGASGPGARCVRRAINSEPTVRLPCQSKFLGDARRVRATTLLTVARRRTGQAAAGLGRKRNTGHAFTMVHRRRPTLGCVPRASPPPAPVWRAGFGSGGAVKFPGIGEGRDMKRAEKRAYGNHQQNDSLARPAVRLLAALISTFVLSSLTQLLARSLGSCQHVSPG